MGFIADALKGSPEVEKANLINAISQASASHDYNRMQVAAAMGLQGADRALSGEQAGQNAQLQALGLVGQTAAGKTTGADPALEQLRMATGQNMQQQAAALGSMQGAGTNPMLAARSIAQQGGMVQQQAAGQAATLQAQQQLVQAQQQMAAQQMLGQMGGQLVGQGQNAIQIAQQGTIAPMQALAQQNQLELANTQQFNTGQQQGYGTSGGMFGTLGAAGAKAFAGAGGMAQGGKVPGKAKYAGDDERNDTVDAKLSPGEIVIPRTFAQDPKSAMAFAAACAMFANKKSK